jgi:putative sterol carrier protein
MPRPFTDAWADACCAAVNASAAYRGAAADWPWPVALAMDAAPELGYPEPLAVELTLDRGACRGARLTTPDATSAPIVLRGAYAAWKHIVRGELDPVTAVATGRLTLARGALTTLMLHTRAARALVAVAGEVPTEFPDER